MKRAYRWIPVFSMILVGGLIWLGVRSDNPTVRADEEAGGQVASLKDQLEKGLRARRPVEFQFIARIVQLVDSGALSREFVLGAFSWTSKKYRDRKYLVPYFEQQLRQRAARAGITALNSVPTTLPNL